MKVEHNNSYVVLNKPDPLYLKLNYDSIYDLEDANFSKWFLWYLLNLVVLVPIVTFGLGLAWYFWWLSGILLFTIQVVLFFSIVFNFKRESETFLKFSALSLFVIIPFNSIYFVIKDTFLSLKSKRKRQDITLLQKEVSNFGNAFVKLSSTKKELENNIEELESCVRKFDSYPDVKEIFLDELNSHKKVLSELQQELNKSWHILCSRNSDLDSYVEMFEALESFSNLKKFTLVREKIQKDLAELKAWNETFQLKSKSLTTTVKSLPKVK
jgi:hypothetical protein